MPRSLRIPSPLLHPKPPRLNPCTGQGTFQSQGQRERRCFGVQSPGKLRSLKPPSLNPEVKHSWPWTRLLFALQVSCRRRPRGYKSHATPGGSKNLGDSPGSADFQETSLHSLHRRAWQGAPGCPHKSIALKTGDSGRQKKKKLKSKR